MRDGERQKEKINTAAVRYTAIKPVPIIVTSENDVVGGQDRRASDTNNNNTAGTMVGRTGSGWGGRKLRTKRRRGRDRIHAFIYTYVLYGRCRRPSGPRWISFESKKENYRRRVTCSDERRRERAQEVIEFARGRRGGKKAVATANATRLLFRTACVHKTLHLAVVSALVFLGLARFAVRN